MFHPCAARQRNPHLRMVLPLLKLDFWLGEEVPKLKVAWTVKLGAVSIPAVELAEIIKSF